MKLNPEKVKVGDKIRVDWIGVGNYIDYVIITEITSRFIRGKYIMVIDKATMREDKRTTSKGWNYQKHLIGATYTFHSISDEDREIVRVEML